MQFSIKVEGLDALKNKLNSLPQKQIPFAIALALTRTAQDVKQAEYMEMQKVFDRPTPWTLRSLYIKPATKQNLEALVGFKDTSSNRVTTLPFLPPEIHGGERQMKRFEELLNRIGILPYGMYVTPGSGCPMDQYGNIPRSLIIQILSYFKAFLEQGHFANITEKRKAKLAVGSKKKRGYRYFVSYGKGTAKGRELLRSFPKSEQGPLRTQHLAPGIYQASSAIKPIFMFVRKPAYRPRFHFYELAKSITQKKFIPNLSIAIHEAKETAR